MSAAQASVLGGGIREEKPVAEMSFSEHESHGYSVIMSEKPTSYCIGVVDMVNSTQLAARLGMTKMSKYYQYFLNFMSKIIEQYDGKVIKNIGDCLLFYFPQKDIHMIEKALECSYAIVSAHDTLCLQIRREGLPCVDYRVSLDYGEVITMTSTDSKTIDMVGPAVNMCSKINRCAERNKIVVGSDMHEIAKHSKTFEFKEIRGISIGFKQCYPVYSLEKAFTY
jgi:class 3 adenylate cyclase